MNIQSFMKTAIAAVALSSVVAGANAASYNLGTISPGDAPKSFNAYSGGSGQMTQFDDKFYFDISSPGVTGGSVVEFLIPGLTSALFTSATLYTDSGTEIASSSGTANSLGFSNALTPAGTYYFHVIGDANGTTYAAYSGSISVALAPVPEPETYAMLMAGLGVMGAIAVRRNKAKKD